MAESGKNRRDRAAAAREAANADERRRERTVRIVGVVTVVVVVLGIIGVAIFARNSADSTADPTAAPTENPSATLPAGVLPAADDLKYGVPYGTASADAPVLAIWEDFQCPACAAVEQANGTTIGDLAEAGKVQLVWRPATFLDRANLGGDPAVENSSSRAAAAWGCAIDAGKTREYHDVLYANHPVNEGDGYTEEQLISFGSQAGISGAALETFTQCVKDGTYLGWAGNSGATFSTSGVAGTPYATLNGVEVPTQTLADPAALEKLVADAAAGKAPASPSPAAS